MNREWMHDRLKDFEALCEEWDHHDSPYADPYDPAKDQLRKQINLAIPTAKEILRRLDPELVDQIGPPMSMSGMSRAERAVQYALGILNDQADWLANLEPDAPALLADRFHEHVWRPASALWDTGMYRVAVGQAAIALSAHIAKKAESSLSERKLVANVFSADLPKPGANRLHVLGDKTSDTWRSRQEGLHLLAQGAFAGIRNVAAHTDDEWSEQVALEHLSVLSVVARWTDETQLMRAP